MLDGETEYPPTACAAPGSLGERGRCRGCAAVIVWGKTTTGKSAPFDPEPPNVNHFHYVPEARPLPAERTDGMTITLGATVRHRISGFEGVAIGRTQYLTGCSRIGVQPRVNDDGKLPDVEWFDEPTLFEADETGEPKFELTSGMGAG